MLKSLTWVGLFAVVAVAVVAIVARETIEVVALRSARQPEAGGARAAPRLRAERLAALTGLVERREAGVRIASPLKATLLGTLVDEERPERSVALIEDASSHAVASYRRFDEVLGATILAIERSQVLVRRAGQTEVIELKRQPERSGALMTPTAAEQFELSRAALDRTLERLDLLAASARIVPVFRDGVARGFKLVSLRPDSLYASLGFQNGDLIERINGIELTCPEKALELYASLRTAPRLVVEFERNGASLRKTLTVL